MTQLLPFERLILEGVGAALPEAQRPRYVQQLAHINKVQRLLDWREIEFFCMRWFRVRWPEALLFENRAEFELGSGVLRAGSEELRIKVWAVGGHVFSIESEQALKPWAKARDLSFAPGAGPKSARA